MKNIVCSWKTTLIGMVIITASICSVFLAPAITWGDALVPMLMGITLILAPDVLISKLDTFIGAKTNTPISSPTPPEPSHEELSDEHK